MSDALDILLVEDLPSDAELMEWEIVRALGPCHFQRVETREEFSDALAQRTPDVILSDYKLPAFDGLSALLVAKTTCPDVPFIIVTSSMNEDTAVACMKAGAWDYVIKEHSKRLGSAILGSLEERRLRLAQRQAVAALRESEAQLKEAQRLGRMGNWRYDPQTRGLTWSEMVYAIYGRDPALGPPTEEESLAYYAKEDRELLGQCARSALENGRRYQVDLTVHAGPERVVEVVVVGAPLREASGRIVGLEGTVQDITERKRMMREYERLATAIEQAAEMVFVADASGLIQYVNPAFEATTGYAKAEAVGRNPRFLKSGKQGEDAYRELWAAITGGRTWKGRLVNKKKDGSLFTQESTISPVRDTAGHVTAYVSVSRDITQDLALEAQFLQAQRMESVGRLAGGVAHDFNNLLSVILTCSGFALDAVPEGEPLREELMEIKRAAERAAALTRQLLAFSRKQMLQPEVFDVNRVLAEMESMLRRILGEDIELEETLPSDLGLVKADPGQIEQVIMNLAVNARDAMPEGGKLAIETANVDLDDSYLDRHMAVKPGPHILIAVSDTGLGMDETTLSRIFEPFFTTKGPGKGTGLGLSTVYGIVKQSGGHVWVSSELGKGTTFRIYLPRELTLPAGADLRVGHVPHRAEGTETVLLVEDDQSVRSIAARILSAAGYTVLTATGGAEALLVCANHAGPIQLVLTDVVMPQMSGQDFVERLIRVRPKTRVLYMSGYTDTAIVHQGVVDEGVHFISKPFTQAELIAKVREVLDETSEERPRAAAPPLAVDPKALAQPATREAVRALPRDMAASLTRAARAARHDELLALLDDLSYAYPDTAWRLRQMVDAFDQDGLLDLLN